MDAFPEELLAAVRFADPRLLTLEWFRHKGYSVDALGLPTGLPVRLTTIDIQRNFHLDYNQAYNDLTGMLLKNERVPRRLPKETIDQAFDEYMTLRAEEAFEEIRAELRYRPEVGSGLVEDWSSHVIVESGALDVAVWKHMIWQVKRKMYSLPIENEMMLNMRGEQGAGKTYTLRKFLSPLRECRGERRLDELLDERNAYILSQFFANMFEELAGASKADIDSLKALMSKDRFIYRKLGHNSHGSGRQNCTFFATANSSVLEYFYDPTGMRRFYEMVFKPKGEFDRAWLASKDILAMWQSVDENAECYLNPFKAELALKQEGLRQKSSVEFFFAENPYVCTGVEGSEIKASDLYQGYKNFCEEAGIQRPVALQSFYNKVKTDVFPELKVRHTNKGNMYNLRAVKPDREVEKSV